MSSDRTKVFECYKCGQLVLMESMHEVEVLEPYVTIVTHDGRAVNEYPNTHSTIRWLCERDMYLVNKAKGIVSSGY